MSTYYTAGYLRSLLKDAPDDEGVCGWIAVRSEQCVVSPDPENEDEDIERDITPEEWEGVVARWEDFMGDSGFEGVWSCLIEAIDALDEEAP